MEHLPVGERDEDRALSNLNEVDDYRHRYLYASVFYLEPIESQWLILLLTHKTPPVVWQVFKDTFAKQNTSSFLDQLNSIFDTQYDTLNPVSHHINQYDTLWNRLHLRCSTASPTDRTTLPFAFKSWFESPKAKAALLLRSLPESINNIVDNLQTKADLTYYHVYNYFQTSKFLPLLVLQIIKRIKALILKEKKRHGEENTPATDQWVPQRNAPTARRISQLPAVSHIPGTSVQNSRPPT